MSSADQVIVVLEVVLTIGPLAVYFLGLGLASSQAQPCLVSERSDFVLLAVAFLPLIVWPVVALLKVGSLGVALLVLVLVAILFCLLLPHRNQGWVIYNISAAECRRALRRACVRLGWQVDPVAASAGEGEALVQPPGLHLSLHGMPWLRNMTIRFEGADGPQAQAAIHLLAEAMGRELRRESLLPSPAGAGLVVIGATLLGLPMWYLFHHMDSIVDVVRMILA